MTNVLRPFHFFVLLFPSRFMIEIPILERRAGPLLFVVFLASAFTGVATRLDLSHCLLIEGHMLL